MAKLENMLVSNPFAQLIDSVRVMDNGQKIETLEHWKKRIDILKKQRHINSNLVLKAELEVCESIHKTLATVITEHFVARIEDTTSGLSREEVRKMESEPTSSYIAKLLHDLTTYLYESERQLSMAM